jgi:hypothetical protein
MGQYGMSCQFWDPPAVKYIHPGLNQYLTGVGRYWWRNSTTCGKCLDIKNTRNGKRTTVIVGDFCPECSPRQLDIVDLASAKLSSHDKPENYGSWLDITEVECNWLPEEEPKLIPHKHTSPWHWYLIPTFLKQPLQNISISNTKGYHDNFGRWVWDWAKPKKEGVFEVEMCDRKTCCRKDFHYITPRDEL